MPTAPDRPDRERPRSPPMQPSGPQRHSSRARTRPAIGPRPAGRPDRPLDLLLDRHRRLADRRPGREIVAASYYGVGPMSAFTIAFQVPNLVRSLFADAALQPAFVPVFTEQLEKGNKREAFRLASTLLLPGHRWCSARSPPLRPARAAGHAALRARLRRRDPRPHGHPLAGPLPDPDPARGQRRRRRHPQQLRPLRRLRDLAAVLEPDDHRRLVVLVPCSTGRTGSTRTRSGSSPAPLVQLADPHLRPAQHPVQVRLELRLAQPATCAACCC